MLFRGDRRYYIGLVREDGSDWKWLSGSDSTYRNWKDGEPNDSGDCGSIQDGDKWSDTECDDKYHYLCEKEKGVYYIGCVYYNYALCFLHTRCDIVYIHVHECLNCFRSRSRKTQKRS